MINKTQIRKFNFQACKQQKNQLKNRLFKPNFLTILCIFIKSNREEIDVQLQIKKIHHKYA